MKKFLSALFIAMLLGPSLVVQAEGNLPDFYIEDFNLIACPEYEAEIEDIDYGNGIIIEQGLIEVGDNYVDYYSGNRDTNSKTIYRIYCTETKLGNTGADWVAADNPDSFANGTRNVKTSTLINIFDGIRKSLGGQVGVYAYDIANGEINIRENSEHVQLAEVTTGEVCFDLGIDVDINPFTEAPGKYFNNLVDESNEDNNTHHECFSVDNNALLEAPANLRITAMDNNSFNIEWDEVEGASSYETFFYVEDHSLWTDQLITPQSSTSAQIPYVGDKLNCVLVQALNEDGYLGAKSETVCTNRSLPTFNDVILEDWYFSYLQTMQDREIINGYSDGNGNLTGQFGGADSLSVAQSLKIVMESLDKHEDVSGVSLDPSLNGHWAADYAKQASVLNLSILNKLEAGVDREITRAEIIEMFVETMGLKVPKTSKYDLSDLAGHANADQIQYAIDLGIISGYPDGTFQPDKTLNRAEITKITNNVINFAKQL